jgi:predicted ATP-grasp superfamily ATP-dependent carboligase
VNYPSVVVTPCDVPAALGIARSLGRRGISIYGVDDDFMAMAAHSKYVKACFMPEGLPEEGRLRFLLDLGKKFDQKAVFFPVSDDAVMLCSLHRNALAEYYEFVLPQHETLVSLVNKDGLYKIAEDCGITSPQTFPVNSLSEVQAIEDRLLYPVILKPALSPSWFRGDFFYILRVHSLMCGSIFLMWIMNELLFDSFCYQFVQMLVHTNLLLPLKWRLFYLMT